uniref:RNA-directed DNA polymerase, eukaryota n=1 Tax=Tanacetum cinerariifolium TaxID=118510 RepID=A0A6L2KWN1_TANCI|nr:RNA-directed DNA polymerase, eukaryota [Tanacetum cinerariifolium]
MDESEPQSKTVSTIPSSEVVPQTNSVSTTPSSGVMKALVVASGFSFGGVAVLSSSSATVMHEAGDILGKKRILKRFLDKDRRTLIEETFLLFLGTLPRHFPAFTVSRTFHVRDTASQTFSFRDLWKKCKEYGRVIDVYIPNRRTKLGDRFGFVHFIHIKDVDRLVKNLCTLWMERLRLHAKVARFQRPPLNKAQHVKGANVGQKSFGVSINSKELLEKFKSHVGVGSWFSSLEYASNSFVIDERAVWVDIERVPMKIWTNNTFKKIASKWGELLFEEDKKNTSLYSKRICIKTKMEQNIFETFKIIIKRKVFWIRAKEITSLMEKNEEVLQAQSVNECNSEMVPDSIFSPIQEEPKHDNKSNFEEGEFQSEDPFHIYDLLVKKPKNDNKEEESSKTTLKYPPGFTPDDVLRTKDVQDVDDVVEVQENTQKSNKQDNFIEDNNFRGVTHSKEEDKESFCLGQFRRSVGPQTGGSILQVMEDLDSWRERVLPMNFLSLNIQGLAHKAKKDWVKKLCNKNKVNFLSLQETKIESINTFCVKKCWGNYSFEFLYGPSMGNSGGILCAWDPRMFHKHNATILDYFVAIQGEWIVNAKKYLIISVYAPQEASEKRMLWSYLNHMIDRWDGESILMGGFNEVRHKEESFGFIFNNHNAMVFNFFISSSGLVEVPQGGCAFTWCHKSGSKMSKLDCFLISKGIMGFCPNITPITLDRYLSDHRPIILREELLNKRMNVINLIHDLGKLEATETTQKAKIKWSIEGDENSKFFHAILNKKRNRHAIRGILSEGNWIEDPNSVKNEFFSHFKERFDSPCSSRLMLEGEFPNKLSADQSIDLESNVTIEEIKRAVWDCGIDKSPGPNGFIFGFYRRYWDIIKKDVADAVSFFFISGNFPKGGNSSFIALIPKMQDAKVVKDYRPISLIGGLYKIIIKILANRLVGVLGELVNEVQSAFIVNRQILDGPFILDELIHWCHAKKKETMIFKVDFEKAYDSVRWDYLDDVLNTFRFGSKWRNWIHNCLNSSKGSILVNGSPTGEFHFRKGLKQDALWSRFIRAVHGNSGGIETHSRVSYSSTWLSIVNEVNKMRNKGIDLLKYMKIQVGNGLNTKFWEDVWMGNKNFKTSFPRIYALESDKNLTVVDKMAHNDTAFSLRSQPRDGMEMKQFRVLSIVIEGVLLHDMVDRWK